MRSNRRMTNQKNLLNKAWVDITLKRPWSFLIIFSNLLIVATFYVLLLSSDGLDAIGKSLMIFTFYWPSLILVNGIFWFLFRKSKPELSKIFRTALLGLVTWYLLLIFK